MGCCEGTDERAKHDWGLINRHKWIKNLICLIPYLNRTMPSNDEGYLEVEQITVMQRSG
jgi:hypothetical protein